MTEREQFIEQAVAILTDGEEASHIDYVYAGRIVDAKWLPQPTGDVIAGAAEWIEEKVHQWQVHWSEFDGQALADSLADEGYLRTPGEQEPPTYLALDLWVALGCDPAAFDAYYERHGWAETWAALLHAVREARGERPCGEMVDGEPCVLLPHTMTPHTGASDVGSGEHVPWVRAQPDEPMMPPETLRERMKADGRLWKMACEEATGTLGESVSIPVPLSTRVLGVRAHVQLARERRRVRVPQVSLPQFRRSPCCWGGTARARSGCARAGQRDRPGTRCAQGR